MSQRFVDHAGIIAALREADRPSYRAIADEFGVSDWTVRSIARQLNNDPRPMKRSRTGDADRQETRGVGWIVAVFVAAIVGAVWIGVRCIPPADNGYAP